jgi:cell division protein FtsL
MGSNDSDGGGSRSRVPGKDEGILEKLWSVKFTLILAIILIIIGGVAANYFLESRNLNSQMDQKNSDYDNLNDMYNNLTYTYNSLVTSDGALSQKYNDLYSNYNNMAVSDEDLQSSFDSLNGTLYNFQESGAVIALAYSYSQGGSSSNPQKVLSATAYNVGNQMAGSVTIEASTIYNNSTSNSQQTFYNVNPLTKVHVQWYYANSTQLGSVWTSQS